MVTKVAKVVLGREALVVEEMVVFNNIFPGGVGDGSRGCGGNGNGLVTTVSEVVVGR